MSQAVGTSTGPSAPGPAVAERADDEPADRTEGPTHLTVCEIHELLRNTRRRFIVATLGSSEETDLGSLAREMAGWENDKEPEEVTSTERKRAYIALYQNHLPKLADADVVEFDADRGDVARGPNSEILERYMGLDEADQQDADEEYLYLIGCGLLCYAFSSLLAGPTSAVAVGILLVTLLAVAVRSAVTDREGDATIRSAYRRLRNSDAD